VWAQAKTNSVLDTVAEREAPNKGAVTFEGLNRVQGAVCGQIHIPNHRGSCRSSPQKALRRTYPQLPTDLRVAVCGSGYLRAMNVRAELARILITVKA